jgi:hypothetical protein
MHFYGKLEARIFFALYFVLLLGVFLRIISVERQQKEGKQ